MVKAPSVKLASLFFFPQVNIIVWEGRIQKSNFVVRLYIEFWRVAQISLHRLPLSFGLWAIMKSKLASFVKATDRSANSMLRGAVFFTYLLSKGLERLPLYCIFIIVILHADRNANKFSSALCLICRLLAIR